MNILRGGQKKSHCDLSLIKIDLFSRCFRPELHSEYLVCKATNRSESMFINLNVCRSHDTHEHPQTHTHRRFSAGTCTMRTTQHCTSVRSVEALKFRSSKQSIYSTIHSPIDSFIPSASHSLLHWPVCSFNQPFK